MWGVLASPGAGIGGYAMPYVRVDVDAFDEIVEEIGEESVAGGRPSGAFEYESAEATFKLKRLGLAARWAYDALVGAGVMRFRVRYDGGYDEGFAQPDAMVFGDGREQPVDEAARELATPERLTALRAAAAGAPRPHGWGDAGEVYATAGPKAVEYALYELAHELASRLLGDGFGTGEYQLYGAFTADLTTGEIVDHEDAAKPQDME
jgi:hypothetical protein